MTKTKEQLKNELKSLNKKFQELSDDELNNVVGGVGEPETIMDYLLSAMEGVVTVDQATMAKIQNLTDNQKTELFFGLFANLFGAEISKEHRYQTFINRLSQYGISTSGCTKAF